MFVLAGSPRDREALVRRRLVAGILFIAACLGTGAVAADRDHDRDCDVPLADWQPRGALQKKLEAEGWSTISIRTDDGCYKVRATNARGQRLKAKFDPASLEPVGGQDGEGDD